MGESPPCTTPSPAQTEGRLDSWKEIAAYLKRDVTTVQRWEKREGMPVHRHQHDRIGSVYAFRSELDDWARRRNLPPTLEPVKNNPLPLTGTRRLYRSPLLLFAIFTALVLGLTLWLRHIEYFWRSPLAGAHFQTVTNFDGLEQSAAISRDGHFIAFLSDRDGPMDVWVTQVGSGLFHNLTHGAAPELVNPLIRNLSFTPDGSLITYWGRTQHDTRTNDLSPRANEISARGNEINVWAVPTLGGQPTRYLQGIAEFDWTADASRIAYHTPGPGDPLFVSDRARESERHLFTAPPGLHEHFPLWSPDTSFIYFVQGTLPDKLDIWRIPSRGGTPERITFHNSRLTHPVFLDRHRLLYLATDPDGSGPWIYSIDPNRRIPHRLTSGAEPGQYTSLAATADGHRLAVTLTSPKRTLWRLPAAQAKTAPPAPIALTTSTGFSPRLGPDFLLYVSPTGTGESLWKYANGTSTQLWTGEGAHIVGAPAISSGGRLIAFSALEHGESHLYVIESNGTGPRILSRSLNLQGAPAWSPGDRSITSAVNDKGTPRLFQFPLNGRRPSPIVHTYSLDPVWSPDGRFFVYSGPDIGTTFPVEAASPDAAAHPFPALMLTRGARHILFQPGEQTVLFLRGDIRHKNLWSANLATGAERQLTTFAPDFDISDFDLSPDGRQFVLERVEERSDIVLLDLLRP